MTVEVVDLSSPEQAQRRAAYVLLVNCWWPHVLHGPIRLGRDRDCVVFCCACGERLILHEEVALDAGVISASTARSPG